MKKNLLTFFSMFASVALMAQAYTYSPYLDVKYQVPDVNFNGVTALDALEAMAVEVDGVVVTNENKQNLGLVWQNFDQAASPSTFDSDWGRTAGANEGITSTDPGGTVVRTWTYGDPVDPIWGVVKGNGNPNSPRIGGGWYMYTVNFSEVADYSLIIRVRGYAQGGDQDFNKYTVTIHDKSNIATVLYTWNVDLAGMTMEDGKGTLSTDTKYRNMGKARAGLSGQATSFWALNVKADERFRPSAAGDYVVKVSHTPGATYVPNAAFGGFSFYVGDLPAATSARKLADNSIQIKYLDAKLKINGVEGATKLSIFNTVGAMVYQKDINADIESELSLPKGIYLVNTRNASGLISSAKILVD
jgi:hypothetical protein